MSQNYLHLRQKMFDTPLMISQLKLEDLMAVVGPRFGLEMPGHEMRTAGPAGGELSRQAAPQRLFVIPVHGTLVNRGSMDAMSGLTSYEVTGKLLDAAIADPTCDAIVLDMDSFGGECSGCFDLSDRIYAARSQKPIYAVVDSNAYSAGYALASAATKIIATSDAGIGSIGVIATHLDRSGNDEKLGFTWTHITAGAHKADFSEHKPLGDRVLSALQASVNESYDRFVATVARNRGLSEKAVRDTEAACFNTTDAKAKGLIDEIMPASEAFSFIFSEIKPMSETNTTAAAVSQPVANAEATQVAQATALAAATAAANANAAAISEMCAAIGQSNMAADFVRRGLSAEQAKCELFDVLAQKGETLPVDTSHANPVNSEAEQATTLLTAAMRDLNKGVTA